MLLLVTTLKRISESLGCCQLKLVILLSLMVSTSSLVLGIFARLLSTGLVQGVCSSLNIAGIPSFLQETTCIPAQVGPRDCPV